METYTNRQTPSESIIRKVYLQQEAEKQTQIMRDALSRSHIWITIDDSTDATGRSIALVLAGSLVQTEFQKPFLILAEEVQQVNNTIISQVFFLIFCFEQLRHKTFILYFKGVPQSHFPNMAN